MLPLNQPKKNDQDKEDHLVAYIEEKRWGK